MHVRSWHLVGGLAAAMLIAGTVLAVTANAGEQADGTANGSLTSGRPAASKHRACKAAEGPAKAVDGSVSGTSARWCRRTVRRRRSTSTSG
jgi:hypothetical protein